MFHRVFLHSLSPTLQENQMPTKSPRVSGFVFIGIKRINGFLKIYVNNRINARAWMKVKNAAENNNLVVTGS